MDAVTPITATRSAILRPLVPATVAFAFGTGARHRLDLSTRSTTPVTASPTGGPA
jgi:hypothetical protein